MNYITRTVKYEEVSIKGVKRWVDAEGKKRQQTKKFYQTVNPFNRGTDGQPKSHAQIMIEIKAERDQWLSESNQEKENAE